MARRTRLLPASESAVRIEPVCVFVDPVPRYTQPENLPNKEYTCSKCGSNSVGPLSQISLDWNSYRAGGNKIDEHQ
jgi:hypothetical protein